MKPKAYYFDINKKFDDVINSVQFDKNSRFIEVNFLSNSQAVNLTGYRATIRAIKPDKTEVFNELKEIDASIGKYELELTEQLNSVAGDVLAQFEIYGEGESLFTTSQFKIGVSKSLSREKTTSSDELGVLVSVMAEAQQYKNNFAKIDAKIDDEVAKTNAQLSHKANKLDVFLKENGININDFDEETRRTFLESQGIDVNYVLGKKNVKTINVNDKAINYEKLSDEIVTITEGLNKLDLKNIVNVNIGSGGDVNPNDSNYAARLRVNKNEFYKLFDINSDGKTFKSWMPRIAITDENSTTLSYYIENTSEFTILDDNAYYLYLWQRGAIHSTYETNKCMALKNYNEPTPTEFIPFNDKIILNAVPKNLSEFNDDLSKWKDKRVVFYGDSITAQGNYLPGVTSNETGYGYYAELVHRFNSIYRGVGGQAFKKNSNKWYANDDGSYAGRYGSGGLTSPPSGTTEHLGYFSSWDRITASIPLTTRTTIDMVIINGGHNDFVSVEDVPTDGVIKASEPKWIPNCDYDMEWKNSAVYNGGDYDITTFTGAIASCIMKLQLWCPNAVIVLSTPFPRWDMDTMQQMKNGELTFRQLCEIEIATANYMQIPVMDLNGNCGINVTNYHNATQSDNVHPNEAGRKLYGSSLIGEFYRIFPKVK